LKLDKNVKKVIACCSDLSVDNILIWKVYRIDIYLNTY
jgi:hypothetical protein